MPVYEVMLELAVRYTARVEAPTQKAALESARWKAKSRLNETEEFSSLEEQDHEISEVQS